ncbi:MAG TPA: shikimate dehydrogenase [Bacteroidia bacterium]|nr:shikimate dehydrogenase [Bacteroidia bacterium]
MKTLGLIGYPLSHSFSKSYFTEKFRQQGLEGDFRYENFPIEEIGLLPDLLNANPDITGLNVTIPFKVAVLPFLNKLTVEAKTVGAVNTIRIKRLQHPGKIELTGHNTDVAGIESVLRPFIGPIRTSCLVLGSGGASRAVCYVLKKLDLPFKIVSRNNNQGCISYSSLTPEIIFSSKLIINTTPLGMYPDIDSAPDLPYAALTPDHYLFDLIYNPAVTLFLKKGIEHHSKILNGLTMLEEQADASWAFWNE